MAERSKVKAPPQQAGCELALPAQGTERSAASQDGGTHARTGTRAECHVAPLAKKSTSTTAPTSTSGTALTHKRLEALSSSFTGENHHTTHQWEAKQRAAPPDEAATRQRGCAAAKEAC